MKLPGEIFKKHIRAGEPSLNGWYVCYTIPEKKSAWSAIPMTEIKTKLFSKNKWAQPDHVIGWIGPLPVFSLDELQGELGSESTDEAYAIGTLKEGMKGQFKDGPFYESVQISFCEGEPGDYAFILNSRKTNPIPFKRWSETMSKWVKIKDKKKGKGKLVQGMKRSKKTQESSSLPYYIGTKKQAAFQSYLAGPFYDINKAMKINCGRHKGDIIWMIFEGDNPFPERIWNESKWEIIDIVKIRKIEKTVRILRKKYETGS